MSAKCPKPNPSILQTLVEHTDNVKFYDGRPTAERSLRSALRNNLGRTSSRLEAVAGIIEPAQIMCPLRRGHCLIRGVIGRAPR